MIDSHWVVFCASSATLLTTLGIVPLQAGIFTTEQVSKVSTETFLLSQGYVNATTQGSDAVIDYSQSAYAIQKSNETKPAFMGTNYTLAPFTPKQLRKSKKDTSWIADTSLYSMDLTCDYVQPYRWDLNLEGLDVQYEVPNDCVVELNIEHRTVGAEKDYISSIDFVLKDFSSAFVAKYENSPIESYLVWPDNFGTWTKCGEPANSTFYGSMNGAFFTALARNKRKWEDPPPNLTAIVCIPVYYRQDVQAVVSAETRAPSDMVFRGPKSAVSSDIFNVTIFSDTIYSAMRSNVARADIVPNKYLPLYSEPIWDSNLTSTESWSLLTDLHPLTAMAVSISNRTLDDLLDPKIMVQAYENALRLFFVRTMNGILASDFSLSREIDGKVHERIESVRLEPVFTHVVTGLFALLSFLVGVMLWFSCSGLWSKGLVDNLGTC
jgi:hypothetical protein